MKFLLVRPVASAIAILGPVFYPMAKRGRARQPTTCRVISFASGGVSRLARHVPPRAIVQGVQALIEDDQQQYVMDTPNLLAVPASLLRQQAGQLSASDQLIAESCIEFMLRGY
jgi:hypothetical protein